MQGYRLVDWKSTLTQKVETLYQKLPNLLLIPPPDKNLIDLIHNNLISVQETLEELRTEIEHHQFENEQEEMVFFKQVKPLFSAALIYWSRVLVLNLHKPIGGERVIKKYWKRKLKELSRFYLAHSDLYEYIRSGNKYMDAVYFLRVNRRFEDAAYSIDNNPRFTTAKDRLVGEMYTISLLEEYLLKMLAKPNTASTSAENQMPTLKWTGSRAGLVELIYALQSGGVYNNGQSGIKEIADTFQQLFKVDLGNYYHVFNEIRLRKKNRTSLLDHLREKVLQKMDDLDEK